MNRILRERLTYFEWAIYAILAALTCGWVWFFRVQNTISSFPREITQAIHFFGTGDQGGYLSAGLSLFQGHPHNQVYYLTAPVPGAQILICLLLNLSKDIHTICLLFYVITCLLYFLLSVVLAYFADVTYLTRIFLLLGSLALILSPDIELNIFSKTILMSDGFGTLLGLLFIAFSLLYLQQRKTKFLMFAFISLSFAGYFRAYWYEISIIGVIFIFIQSYLHKRRVDLAKKRKEKKAKVKVLSRFWIPIACLGIFVGITLPWRVVSNISFGTSYLSWSKEGGSLLVDGWRPKREWVGSWLDGTGAFYICELKPKTCSEIQEIIKSGSLKKNMSLVEEKTFSAWVENMAPMLSHEYPIIIRGIFSSPESYTPGKHLYFDLFNISSLLIGSISIYIFIKRRYWNEILFLFFILVSSTFPLVIFHTENRYVFFLLLIPWIAFTTNARTILESRPLRKILL
jgi:hypothetical protein